MGIQSIPCSHSSEEILTFLEIVHPPIPNDLEENPDVLEIHEDFKKLDIPTGSDSEVNSYSPDDLINYNDGQPANPFNKLAKVYGRHKDVFLFVAVVFNQKQHDKFMTLIREKYEEDVKALEKFMRKMKTYMNRISKGMEDANKFLPEELKDCPAFFNGYHVDNLPAHRRNIHENLNINVVAQGKKLATSGLFSREIPDGEEGSSELRRLKIYANGQRAMTIYKEENGQRSYTPTKAAEMDLEIKWLARDPQSGEEVKCLVVLGLKNGRINVKKGGVEGDDGELLKTNLSILELAKQNEGILIRKKTLHQILEKKAENKGKAKRELVEVATPAPVENQRSKERLIPVGLPKPTETEKDKMDSVSMLSFAPGPCMDAKDELNYNEGKEANPFDKLAKVEGRQKDVFKFNQVLQDSQQFDAIMNMVRGKCGEDDAKLKAFIQRKDIYLKRIGQGRIDAEEIMGKDFDPGWMEAFTHGYHVAREGHPKNIHSNLNLNLTKVVGGNNKGLETSGYLGNKLTPRMEQEESKVERVKIYGNGRRLANITMQDGAQRKYSFSRLAEMDMEVEWVAVTKKDQDGKRMEVNCVLVLGVNKGQISVKGASVNEVPVELGEMLELAKQNREVLVGNKDLAKVVRELLMAAEPIMIEGAGGGMTSWKYNSVERLTIHEFFGKKTNDGTEDGVKALLEDVAMLDFANELCKDPNDVLNYNDGLKASPFSKLRKYWGRHKSLLSFLAICEDPNQREKILELVGAQCGDNVKAKENFQKCMARFLKRMEDEKQDAADFLKLIIPDYEKKKQEEVSAVFGGYQEAQPGHPKNVHGNLNINLGESKPGLTLHLPDIFLRTIPRMVEEKSQLGRIKVFGDGERILTVIKDGQEMQRKYLFSKMIDMDIQVGWWFQKKDDKMMQDKAELLLNVKNGVVSVLHAKIKGEAVSPLEILETAKENREVLFGKKSLYEILHGSVYKKEPKPGASGSGGPGASAQVKNADDEFVVIEEEDGGVTSGSEDMFGQW